MAHSGNLHVEGLAFLPGLGDLEEADILRVLLTAIERAPRIEEASPAVRRFISAEKLEQLMELMLGPGRALPTSAVHGLMVACVALSHVEGLGRVQEVLQLEPGVLQGPPSSRWDVGVLSQQQLELLVKLAEEHGMGEVLLVLAQQLRTVRERQVLRAAVRAEWTRRGEGE
jgi:hypothetical protein